MRYRIFVLSHGTQWKVQCEHCNNFDIVAHQNDAIAIARQHVKNYPEGTLSQILVQKDDGKYREEWTYGKDPYPPKG